MDDRYKKLNIIWCRLDSPNTFQFIVRKKALEAVQQDHCESVQVTVMDSTVRTMIEHEAVREGIEALVQAGVRVVVCRDSAERYGLLDKLAGWAGVELRKLGKRAVDDASGPDEKIAMV